MKFAPSLLTLGVFLLASAPLSCSRALPGHPSQRDVNLIETAPNSTCVGTACAQEKPNPELNILEVRAPPGSGAGAGAGGAGAGAGAAEAGGAGRIPPVVPAPGSPAAGSRPVPLPESPGAAAPARGPPLAGPPGARPGSRPGTLTPEAPEAPAAPAVVRKPASPDVDNTQTPGSSANPPEGIRQGDGGNKLNEPFWNDMSARMAAPDFNTIKPNERTALYTGEDAWKATTDFTKTLTDRGEPTRSYLDTIKTDTQLQALIDKYKADFAVTNPGVKVTLPNGMASYKLALMAREQPQPVHVIFSTEEEAAAAIAKAEVPKGHLKYYEMYAITSPGTKVPEVFVWDAVTYKTHLSTPGYTPPTMWKAGDPPIGKPVDFWDRSETRTD